MIWTSLAMMRLLEVGTIESSDGLRLAGPKRVYIPNLLQVSEIPATLSLDNDNLFWWREAYLSPNYEGVTTEVLKRLVEQLRKLETVRLVLE